MRILSVLATALVLAQPVFAEEAKPTIVVTGEGRVDTAPDMATISLGVMTEGDTAAEALASNTAQLTAAIDRLRASGVADRDIQTSGLNLGPRYDYNRTNSDGSAQITGFVASNMVTVRIRALDTLGTVLDAAVTDGANTLNGVTFGLQMPDPVLDAARKDAVADARRKAELYAAAAGVTLGKVQSITEQSGYTPPVPMAMADASFSKAEGAPVPVQGGEVAVMANVTIVYAIGE
jgi:hypothetical protein